MKPITRKEKFLAAFAGERKNVPTPITREEIWIKKIFENKGNSGGGGTSNNSFYDDVKVNNYREYDTNYTLIRVNKEKINGEYQFPFVVAPDGLNMLNSALSNALLHDDYLITINSGVGNVEKGYVLGQLIENGVVLQASNTTSGRSQVLAIDSDGNLRSYSADSDVTDMLNDGIVSAVVGFCTLVSNYVGTSSNTWVGSTTSDRCQRQIIGQFGNGDYGIISCEGRNFDGSIGWTYQQSQAVCLKHGFKFAYNLDGGGSVETVVGKKQLNTIYEGEDGRKVGALIIFNGKNKIATEAPTTKKLVNIYCGNTPSELYKIEISKGNDLDLSGVPVKKVYSDGTKGTIPLSKVTYDTSLVNVDVVGSYKVIVTYKENNKTYTCNIYVDVVEVTPEPTPEPVYGWVNIPTTNAKGHMFNFENETFNRVTNEAANTYTYAIFMADGSSGLALKDINNVQYGYAIEIPEGATKVRVSGLSDIRSRIDITDSSKHRVIGSSALDAENVHEVDISNVSAKYLMPRVSLVDSASIKDYDLSSVVVEYYGQTN
jgi:exopolysaccharide biosynthesis protein